MNAQQMWEAFGGQGAYEAWRFGGNADALAELVLAGKKTATASAYPLYELENEPLPRAGEYSVILNSRDEAVCVIQTTKVYVVPFDQVSPCHAAREGEGDLSLAYWREVHRVFFTGELKAAGLGFRESMKVVCEEFKKVFPNEESLFPAS